MSSTIRLKNDYGEYLVTGEDTDDAIARFLPASVNGLREVMTGIAPAGDGYAKIHSVTEFLIMIAARKRASVTGAKGTEEGPGKPVAGM